MPGGRRRRRDHQIQAVRYPGQRRVLADRDVVGVGPGRPERGDQQLPEYLVAGSEPLGSLAGFLNDARAVGA
jgi:hypothetical protein